MTHEPTCLECQGKLPAGSCTPPCYIRIFHSKIAEREGFVVQHLLVICFRNPTGKGENPPFLLLDFVFKGTLPLLISKYWCWLTGSGHLKKNTTFYIMLTIAISRWDESASIAMCSPGCFQHRKSSARNNYLGALRVFCLIGLYI